MNWWRCQTQPVKGCNRFHKEPRFRNREPMPNQSRMDICLLSGAGQERSSACIIACESLIAAYQFCMPESLFLRCPNIFKCAARGQELPPDSAILVASLSKFTSWWPRIRVVASGQPKKKALSQAKGPLRIDVLQGLEPFSSVCGEILPIPAGQGRKVPAKSAREFGSG